MVRVHQYHEKKVVMSRIDESWHNQAAVLGNFERISALTKANKWLKWL